MDNVLIVLKNAAVLDFAVQGGGFLLATAFKTEKFYDFAGTGTCLLLALKSLQWGGAQFSRQYIQTGCASIWAARLGSYLVHRILKTGEDKRFEKIKGDPKRFAIAWFLQGVWVISILMPTLIQNAKRTNVPVGWREYVGWGAWLTGFLIQLFADQQKSAFRTNPANAGRFIQSGLWSLSRHPNYFGEILMWAGLYLSASRSLEGWEHISIISPVMTILLLTQVSGIPLLEKAGLRSWGSDPNYQKYLRETPVLIPSLSKLFR